MTDHPGVPGTPDPGGLARAIVDLLASRRQGASICPSDVARAVGGTTWRSLMDQVRDAAWTLEQQGAVVITQRGQRVDRNARGPIRIARP